MKNFYNVVLNWLIKIQEKYKSFDRKKRIYAIFAIIFFVVLLWAFISATLITCNFNRSQLNNAEDDQRVSAKGIIITETKDGKKYFEIYGESGSYNNDENVAVLDNVVGNFYKNNEVSMSFQSTKGTYNEKTGVITLYKNTYIVLKDNTSLLTDSLVWSGSDKDTVAEGNVQIKKGNDMIALADKCIISANYDNFKIIGKTQTKIYGNKVN